MASSSIHLICATAQTGKDTLHRQLKSGELQFNDYNDVIINYSCTPMFVLWPIVFGWNILLTMAECVLRCFGALNDKNVRWYIFGTDASISRARCVNLFTTRNRIRVGFADALKRECNETMRAGMTQNETHSDEWFEANKDNPVIKVFGQSITPRSFYICTGTMRRKSDPDIWIRKCFETIKHIRTNSFAPNVIDITDYRFRNEGKYAKTQSEYVVFTTRLYRGIKPAADISEHDLDAEPTDFLMVTSIWQYVKAIFAHPQYARYSIVGDLRSASIRRQN